MPEDTVVGDLGKSVTEPASDDPTSALPAPPAGSIARSDEVIDQAPVIPFPVPSAGPRLVPADLIPPNGSASVQLHDYAAPTVATAILFLSPANAVLTGQVVRVGG